MTVGWRHDESEFSVSELLKRAAPLLKAMDAGGGDYRAPGTKCACCGKAPEDPARDLYRLKRPAVGVAPGVLVCFQCRWQRRGYAVMSLMPGNEMRCRPRGQATKMKSLQNRDEYGVHGMGAM